MWKLPTKLNEDRKNKTENYVKNVTCRAKNVSQEKQAGRKADTRWSTITILWYTRCTKGASKRSDIGNQHTKKIASIQWTFLANSIYEYVGRLGEVKMVNKAEYGNDAICRIMAVVKKHNKRHSS